LGRQQYTWLSFCERGLSQINEIGLLASNILDSGRLEWFQVTALLEFFARSPLTGLGRLE